MVDKRITELDALLGADVAAGDFLPLVDISDATMAASGTDKKIRADQLGTALSSYVTLSVPGTLVYNVKDYGAIGDGLTDDTTAISDTITAATGDAGTVFFPAGTYMANGLTVAVAGMTLVGAGATLKKNGDATHMLILNADRVTLDNLTIDCNAAAYSASTNIVIGISQGSDDVTIRNCRILNGLTNTVQAIADTNPIRRLAITDCYFTDGAGVATPNSIYLEQDIDGAIIARNTFNLTNGDTTAFGANSSAVGKTIKRVRFVDNDIVLGGTGTTNSNAMGVSKTSGNAPFGCVMANNTITCTNNCFAACTCDGATQTSITNNTFTHAGAAADYGIELVECSFMTVTGNNLDLGGIVGAGIYLNDTSDSVVADNVVVDPSDSANSVGIGVAGVDAVASRNLVIGNTVRCSGAIDAKAISVGAGNVAATASDNRIIGNYVYGNASSRGIYVNGSAGTTANNVVEHNAINTASLGFVFQNDAGTIVRNNELLSVGTPETFLGGTTGLIRDLEFTATTATMPDAVDIVLNTGTGSKIGTGTTQKLGFWNASPSAQPTTAVAEASFTENAGGAAVNVDSTFDGYTLQQVVKALRNIGLLA